jgi:hypothetical protein
MSIKDRKKSEVALSTANLFLEQYRKKGLLADVDMKANGKNKLVKEIEAIDDKKLTGYDCDELPKKHFWEVWGNVWPNATADNQEKENTEPNQSIKI